MNLIKDHPLGKIVNGALVDLPAPSNLSSFWNFGSLLGLSLGVQVFTGLFLAIHYTGDCTLSFGSVIHLVRDVPGGWLFRTLHANGASLFFIFLYLHCGRGVYYSSFVMSHTWSVGVVIFLLVMAAAFLGYVLPWGQMSFWGSTVITNLFSAIPKLGYDILTLLLGAYAVSNSTLTRFFTFHFLVPFLVIGLVGVHLLFLHQSGSSTALGMSQDLDKIIFLNYYILKDLVGMLIACMGLLGLVSLAPWLLGDSENFILANALVTPVHIQPEWYFLFAYAILRSIPNKLGGVLALAGSILVLLILPFLMRGKFRGLMFYPVSRMVFWALVVSVLLLTWIGARPVEDPYIEVGQTFTMVYFFYFLVSGGLYGVWDEIF